MNLSINPGQRSGKVTIPSSKSMAHRYLIAAALSGKKSLLKIDGISKDIEATLNCLKALNVKAEETNEGILLTPPSSFSKEKIHYLNCNESGSTLRFLLPTVAALGLPSVFEMAEGLAKRPTDELIRVLTEHGVQIEKQQTSLKLTGALTPGEFTIPGNISSQYISGLLFALPLLSGDSTLRITEKCESRNYILMTENVLSQSGIKFDKKDNAYYIPGNQHYEAKDEITVEADWSNAAFFLCAGALSENGITVNGLNPDSPQGDKAIIDILQKAGAKAEISGNSIKVKKDRLNGLTIDAKEIPDLVPVICALASLSEGTTKIINASRLRLKESDRLETTQKMLSDLGADIEIINDELIINGKPSLNGGKVNSANDHRIAMAAAVAAVGCRNEVTVTQAECVEKSYPAFWEHFDSLEVTK